ncbi:MAG: hypothetical protein L3J10_08635 [Sulfurimonas sp.]|nr:hypothetical protein [Sulfurimonas sp.]
MILVRNLFFIFIIALLFSGCGGTKNIKIVKNDLTKMNGKTIVVTLGQELDFIAKTTDSVILGKMAKEMMIREGNQIIKNNNVKNPVHYIKKNFINALSTKASFNIELKENIEPSNDYATLINKYSDKDYILDIRTTKWSLAYFIWDWNVYKVIYSAKLRLINTKNGDIIAKRDCSYIPDNIKTAPTYSKFLENDAQILKNELQLAADKCLNEFTKSIFY